MRIVPVLVLLVGCVSVPDSANTADAAPNDAPNDAGPPACPVFDQATIALYLLDDMQDDNDVIDVSGSNRHGVAVGGFNTTDGQCGGAYQAVPGQYLTVPSEAVFENMSVGSLDFWLRVPAEENDINQAVISRDGTSPNEGDFTLYIAPGNTIRIRLQSGIDSFRCWENPLTEGDWVHIGVNFGPPTLDLYVSTTLALYDQNDPELLFDFSGLGNAMPEPCTWSSSVDTTSVFSGPPKPWVFGANNGRSPAGELGSADEHMRTGAIDHLRISDQRRDFSMTSAPALP